MKRRDLITSLLPKAYIGAILNGLLKSSHASPNISLESKPADAVTITDFLSPSEHWNSNKPTDVTQALQSALNTGKDVYIPAGSGLVGKTITFKKNRQRILGAGTLSSAPSLMDHPLLQANSLNGVSIIGIKLSGSNLWGQRLIIFDSCTNGQIVSCTITRHGKGVAILNSSNISITSNTFKDAAPDERFSSSSSSDVYIGGGCSQINVEGNTQHSGGGYGIEARVNQGESISDLLFENNEIIGYNSYGIMLYRNGGPEVGEIINARVISNTVKDIAGSRPFKPGGQIKIFGTGIYFQGAENFLCSNNILAKCNQFTNSDLLAPGAIGIANSGAGSVVGNEITDTTRDGINIKDSNFYGARDGIILVEDNNIRKAGRNGIKIAVKSNLTIKGGEIDGAIGNGILIGTDATRKISSNIEINSVAISNCGGAGIAIDSIENPIIVNNRIFGGGSGISIENSSQLQIERNTVTDTQGRGVYISATNKGKTSISENSARGNKKDIQIDESKK